MNILIINHFDKLPGEKFRDQRYTFLYEKLKRNNDITWISSDFHHWSHKKRDIKDIPNEDKNNIVLIKTIPYKNNVSIKRFISHSAVSVKTFFYLLKSRKQYDSMIIIAPVENLFLSTIYAKLTKTRLIIDILDLWPDLFEQAFPQKLQFLANILLYPFHLMANYSYKNANHITSVSKTYTMIAMKRGNRHDTENSSYFYLGAQNSDARYNIKKNNGILKCLFAGQFGHNYDIELILEVAKECQKDNLKVEFYLAGSGTKQKYIEEYINKNKLKNVFLLGWLSSSELINIANKCHIGLNSYKSLATQSIPTKIYDYMSMGLVVVNSLEGEIQDMIQLDNSGYNYQSENIDSLYNLINKLYLNLDELISIGAKNKVSFSNKYSFDTIYNDMTKMILQGDS